MGVYFFFEKYCSRGPGEKNTGDTIKKRVFFNGASFLTPAKFRRKNQEKKKIRTPTCLKYL